MGQVFTKKTGEEGDGKYMVSTGLYKTCDWDHRTVKKMIIEKKLAPIYQGKELTEDIEKDANLEECPICFLYYPGGLNRAKCCKKPICTECYLQIKKPTSTPVSCPFCNGPRYQVVYSGPLSKEEKDREEKEEQQYIEMKIQQESQHDKNIYCHSESPKSISTSPPKDEEFPEFRERLSSIIASSPRNSEQLFEEFQIPPPTPPQLTPIRQRNSTAAVAASHGATRNRSAHRNRPASSSLAGFRSRSAPNVPPMISPYDLWNGDMGLDIEEIMVMEAIRLSLMENSTQQTQSVQQGTVSHEHKLDGRKTNASIYDEPEEVMEFKERKPTTSVSSRNNNNNNNNSNVHEDTDESELHRNIVKYKKIRKGVKASTAIAGQVLAPHALPAHEKAKPTYSPVANTTTTATTTTTTSASVHSSEDNSSDQEPFYTTTSVSTVSARKDSYSSIDSLENNHSLNNNSMNSSVTMNHNNHLGVPVTTSNFDFNVPYYDDHQPTTTKTTTATTTTSNTRSKIAPSEESEKNSFNVFSKIEVPAVNNIAVASTMSDDDQLALALKLSMESEDQKEKNGNQ